ncbi:hypothetical protein Poli38472_011706 [Pythium oligandrum]|uniref:Uncharacterized protein n=1 Tax=Pythium oligandrum TaxID=41045 RepID=A0A8K1C8F3_PYTOL|nr:hypothetical protein Poli38472_011706 [Pythium oligandrum]|eukprot:TMW58118.1 hypothetical protein Poli38472_011706 [Pythium oligandrum]
MNDRWRDLYHRVREEGCVEHELLQRLELWREVDDTDLLLELKLLMFELQLAYPTGVEGIRADSGLIVPLYWKKSAPSSTVFGSHSVVNTSWLYRVRWEYEFQEHLPEDFFEKLGVQSSSLYYSTDREFAQDTFKSTVVNEYETIIRKKHAGAEDKWECDIVTLSIGIGASDERVAWQQLKRYAMNIEKLLETYPGLWVKRYAVSTSGKCFALDQLVSQMQRTKVCPSGGLLPPSMEWYTSRVWQRCSDVVTVLPLMTDDRPPMSALEQLVDKMNDLENGQRAGFQAIERTLNENKRAIIQVKAAAGNRMLYPALWTLEYQPRPNRVTAAFTLKFRSELSGVCYHEDEPIVTTVGNAFLGMYGSYIRTGLSFFSSVVPDMFGKSAIETIIGACTEQLDRTVQVHSLVEGLNLSATGALREMNQDRSMSPGETLALLLDLLQVKYKADFDVLKMAKYSGLECGIVMESMTSPYAVGSGSCIWASREDIEQCGSKMIVAHDYVPPRVEKEENTGAMWFDADDPTEGRRL